MARRTSRFVIGLFVIVGVLLGVAAVVWLGASRYFEKGTRYLTYFDESVQGLQPDSRVKYRGVDVGKVERIGVAHDQKLVEVLIKIDLEGDLERDIVTQLKAAGITGIVFIELDRRNPDDQVLFPPKGMETPHPVIPSQLSQTKQMLSSVDRIMERVETVDLKGISDQTKATTRAVETFFSGRRMTSIMRNLDSTTASLESSLRKIDGLLAAGKVDGLLEEAKSGLNETRQGIAETRQGIAETRRLITDTGQEIQALRVGETVTRLNRLLDGLDGRTKAVTADLESTTDSINQAMDHLRLLIDQLRENPSELIFSRPRSDAPREGK